MSRMNLRRALRIKGGGTGEVRAIRGEGFAWPPSGPVTPAYPVQPSPHSFNPASLFNGTDYGFILDLSTATIEGAAGVAVSTGGGVAGVYPARNFNSGLSGTTGFVQATPEYQPTLQRGGGLIWLQFDGIDDWLSAPTIRFNSLDAATVIAAIRREQRDNVEDVFGLTTDPTANSGTILIEATRTASSDTIGYSSRGSSISTATATGSLVGDDFVITGQADISDDSILIRRNGVQVGSSSANQGAGSYNNGKAGYLGSRGGSSRFFKGRLYGLLVINRLLNATELGNAESWMASKCGATI